MVTKFQKCPLTLPAPPVKPSCPMREDEDAIQQHLIKCDIMNWFNLIKVENIAFYDAKLDDAVEGFGYYSMGTGLDGKEYKSINGYEGR